MDKKIWQILGWGVIVLLFASNIFTIYILFSQNSARINKVTEEQAQKNKESIRDKDNNQAEKPLTEKNQKNISLGENDVLLEWNEWPVKTSIYSIFNYQELADAVDKFNKENPDFVTEVDSYLKTFDSFAIGKIKSGKYAGADLNIINFTPEGPSYRAEMYRVVVTSDGKTIVLGKYSDELYGVMKNFCEFDNDTVIANINPPSIIKVPDSDMVLKMKDKEPYRWLTEYNQTEVVFTIDGLQIYKTQDGCYIARANDGTVREYDFELNFAKDLKTPEYGRRTFTPQINWLDQSINGDEYFFDGNTPCSDKHCYEYPSYFATKKTNSDEIFLDPQKTLQVTGELAGEKFYEFIFKQNADINPAERESIEKILRDIYDMYMPLTLNDEGMEVTDSEQKISFEQFVANHPLIFWRDPFGKFIVFSKVKYAPMAECGKPVIYLYPESKIDVEVKVAPTGGFSKTEPDYNNGWLVSAEPNGRLYNYADQKQYPYLFWEGYGIDYHAPPEGFVVAREGVEEFLNEKLPLLGLLPHEYNEFIEFWLPRMQDNKYYFITFMPQNEFDQLAPLEVSPRPDTVIRVFMDYQGLDQEIIVPQQKIITPQRQGFTVVEWGGALHQN